MDPPKFQHHNVDKWAVSSGSQRLSMRLWRCHPSAATAGPSLQTIKTRLRRRATLRLPCLCLVIIIVFHNFGHRFLSSCRSVSFGSNAITTDCPCLPEPEACVPQEVNNFEGCDLRGHRIHKSSSNLPAWQRRDWDTESKN